MSFPTLEGCVCLVTGASRGIGKGIAIQLGKEKAIVYVTGRTLKKRPDDDVGGSLEETVEEINSRGGKGIAIQCDHSNDASVEAVFKQIGEQQDGRLDILVNSAYSAVQTIGANFSKKFWECDIDMWDKINNVGLRGNYVCTVFASRMMVERGNGLIVNVTSLGGLKYIFNVPYGVGKCALDRLTADSAHELKSRGVAVIGLCPGAVATEEINRAKELEKNKKFGEIFKDAESPEFSGITLVALLKEKDILNKRSGRIILTGDLGDEHSLVDIDGRKIISLRSMKASLKFFGLEYLAKFIPSWLKFPKFMLTLAGSKY